MADLNTLLGALATKEAAATNQELIDEVKSTRQAVLTQLNRLKDKGYVEGNSQEGWFITDEGRKQLEKGPIRSTMIEEGITPREKFESIARRIGITEERISIATDIVWSGEYTDVKWVWEALGQADIRDDLRKIWVNTWRAFLQKSIPPELETELAGPSVAGEGVAHEGITIKGSRDFIIFDDEPVRVGPGLGDYSLQDAKDILSIRALRSRFTGVGKAGGGQAGGTAEKVSDIITALQPYINKGTDMATLKEIIGDKMELQKQDILNRMPQPGQPAQPKSFIEQMTEFTGILGQLGQAGPTIRALLGIPETPTNPSTALPIQLLDGEGKPMVMDLSQFMNLEKFRGDERRADERHQALTGLAQTVRENIGDGIAALRAAAEEVKGTGFKGAGTKPHAPAQPQTFECGECHTKFSPPAGWAGEPLKCPNPDCGKEYTKEELLG